MELTLSEVKPLIKYIIERNKELEASGHSPISVNLTSAPGIGKSTICKQIADELDANYIFLSLSMLTEPSDLVGYPLREHYACFENKETGEQRCDWIAAELIDSYISRGWTVTSETRMSYAIPQWMVGLDPQKQTICVLDDYSRCTPAIMQAIMQLIYKQEYFSWKLPPNSTILLTSNTEEDGSNVIELDEAQKSRLINFSIKFSVDDWARYAEEIKLDDRSINFLLTYSDELMKRTPNGASIMNARSYTMFSNIIGGFKDWGDSSTMASILQIASGCFLDEDNIVGTYFTLFIKNKLDKLISPKDMLLGDWATIKTRIKNCVYDDRDNYHPEIASVLATRLLNYTMLYFDTKGSETKKVQERLLELIDSDVMLFSEDLIFNGVKTLAIKNASRMNKLIVHPKIMSKMF